MSVALPIAAMMAELANPSAAYAGIDAKSVIQAHGERPQSPTDRDASGQPRVVGGRLAAYVNNRDYPGSARRRGEEGTVRFALSVDRRGRPRRCWVTVSSGFASLDSATCRVMVRRTRFTPARDSNGQAVASEFYGMLIWRLP